jgi:hypothetical protein
MPKLTTLNLRVLPTTASWIRKDSIKFNKAVDQIGDRILRWFLSTKSPEERQAFYASLKEKRNGRRLYSGRTRGSTFDFKR